MAYLTPNNAAEFWNRGFVLHNLRLEADEVQAALAEVHTLDYKPIFGEVYDDEMDEFREQASLTTLTPALAAIHQRVVNVVSTNDECVVDETSWHTLRSSPGGADQAVHRDFPNFEASRALLTHELVQASVFVALMDDTFLNVWLVWRSSRTNKLPHSEA
ncbi:hypothetical protein JG688_00014396 [Phytophthora aleatoria]|uniref:Uncharacterized protein n=1 Tax=Phytophthora aleatoria TaxID=2496075 RepID=A0A8J5LXK5_9STRA|nr:hypothetical protein JG688_00014396 [Phytophthora aleatoria]